MRKQVRFGRKVQKSSLDQICMHLPIKTNQCVRPRTTPKRMHAHPKQIAGQLWPTVSQLQYCISDGLLIDFDGQSPQGNGKEMNIQNDQINLILVTHTHTHSNESKSMSECGSNVSCDVCVWKTLSFESWRGYKIAKERKSIQLPSSATLMVTNHWWNCEIRFATICLKMQASFCHGIFVKLFASRHVHPRRDLYLNKPRYCVFQHSLDHFQCKFAVKFASNAIRIN